MQGSVDAQLAELRDELARALAARDGDVAVATSRVQSAMDRKMRALTETNAKVLFCCCCCVFTALRVLCGVFGQERAGVCGG